MTRYRSSSPPLLAIAALILHLAATPAMARAGDVSSGMDVFRSECAECHTVRQGHNKKGPSLFAVVGRHAGTLPGYHYSDAMKQADWTWTRQRLQWYLSQPARKAVPGVRMKYDGLDDSRDRDDLISFLETLH